MPQTPTIPRPQTWAISRRQDLGDPTPTNRENLTPARPGRSYARKPRRSQAHETWASLGLGLARDGERERENLYGGPILCPLRATISLRWGVRLGGVGVYALHWATAEPRAV